MELYEFNKVAYTSLPKMSKSRIEANQKALSDWLSERKTGKYWLLLNNESHYYTFFLWCAETETETFAKEVVGLVKELGTLKSIEPNSTGDAYEFWITGHDAETRMYLFFNYDRGVIEV